MFRLWGKKIKNNKMLENFVIEDMRLDVDLNTLVKDSVMALCERMDLGQPIWLASHYKDLSYHHQTRFRGDDFIEEVDFDFFEIVILEYVKY